MSNDAPDDMFAAPPFKPDEALQRLARELRALGLSEREGRFERRGLTLARARIDGESIVAARVRKPSRSSPEWVERRLGNSAQLRDFVVDLKKQLATWTDRDD